MVEELTDLLKPEIIQSLNGLELIAKVVTDDIRYGLNKSKTIGAGGDFNQYRSYEQGDEPRQIDWKLFGRTERYYTKLTERQTHVKVKFLLDRSESMLHEEANLAKADYSKVLLATMGYLADQQGDELEFYAISGNVEQMPINPRQPLMHFLHHLSEVKCEGKWSNTAYEDLHWLHSDDKELIILATDLHQHNLEIVEFVKQLKTPRNEVLVLLVVGREEKNFDYHGVMVFEELETSRQVKVNAKDVKRTYREAYKRRMEDLQDEFFKLGVGMEEFVMGEDLADAVRLFLVRRSQLI